MKSGAEVPCQLYVRSHTQELARRFPAALAPTPVGTVSLHPMTKTTDAINDSAKRVLFLIRCYSGESVEKTAIADLAMTAEAYAAKRRPERQYAHSTTNATVRGEARLRVNLPERYNRYSLGVVNK